MKQPPPVASPTEPSIDFPDKPELSPAAGADSGSSIDFPDKPSQLEDIYHQVAPSNPDTTAQVVNLGRQLDTPPTAIAGNLDAAKRAAAAPPPSFFDDLEARYPGTTKYLADPKNMAVAHDDLPNLAAHEALIQGAAKSTSILDAIKAGLENSVPGLATRGLPDIEVPEDAPFSHRFAKTAAQFVADYPLMFAGGIAGGLAGTAAMGPVTGTLAGGAAGFAVPEMMRTALLDHYLKGDVKGAGDLIDRMLHVAKEGTKQGIVGAFTGVAGVLGGGVTGDLLKTKLASEFLGMTTAGSAVEGRLPTTDDLAQNALLMGGMHGIHAATHVLRGKKARESKAFYDDFGKIAEKSKLKERLPDQYGKHVGDITKDTAVENVYVPATAFDEYFQSKGMDPALVAESLGVTDSRREALATNGSVEVPMGTWAEKIAGTEHYQALADDVKFHPEDLTAREVKTRQKEIADQIKAAEEAAQEDPKAAEAQAEKAAALEESGKRLEKEFYDQAVEAGRTQEEAKRNAQIFRAFWETQAKTFGVDPYQMAKLFHLSFERGRKPGEGRAFEQGFMLPDLPEDLNAEYFKTPEGKGDKELPHLQKPELALMGREDKPIVIKENIAVKNLKHEKAIKGRDREILQSALYSPTHIIEQKPGQRDNYWSFIGTSPDGKTHALLDMAEGKDQYELVTWYPLDPRDLRRMLRKAKREGASILITDRANPEGAARRLSALTPDHNQSITQGGKGKPDGGNEGNQGGGTHFQSPEKPPAPPFYSKLTRTIEEKMGGSATVEQVRGLTKDIKEEERKWLGLDEFLKGKEKVSKPELLEFLRANALNVEEVTRGGGGPDDSNTRRADFIGFAEESGMETADAERMANKIIDGLAVDIPEELRGPAEQLRQSVEREESAGSHGTGTKFEKYTLPGGENYREVLFTLPVRKAEIGKSFQDWALKKYGDRFLDMTDEQVLKAKEEFKKVAANEIEIANPSYRSSHWDEANVLAHVRLNDRTTADGKRVLHVEEVQSDWHQEGRKKGYKSPDTRPRAVVEKELNAYEKGLLEKYKAQAKPDINDKIGMTEIHRFITPEEQEHRAKLIREFNENAGAGTVPDAPFKKTWHEFALKKILRMAAEGGYDAVTWTPGEQQAERYDLSKQVKEIEYVKNDDGTYKLGVTGLDGEGVPLPKDSFTPDELEGVVGKEIAQKIVDGGGKKYRGHEGRTLKDVDLKVGGEGMKGFYDKIVPDFLNKFGKKYGAKVGEAALDGVVLGTSREDMQAEHEHLDELKKQRAEVPAEITLKDFGGGDGRFDRKDLETARWMGSGDPDNDLPIKAHKFAGETEIWVTWKDQKKIGAYNSPEELAQNLAKDTQKFLDDQIKDREDFIASIAAGADAVKVPSLPITPELKKAAIEEGFPLFQGDKENPRGSINFQDQNGEFHAAISFFKGADKTTLPHEMGHYFFEVMGRLAEKDGAPDTVREDYQTLLKELGVASRSEVGKDQHEQLARWFENYLATGEAPTPKLQRAFDRFKEWILNAYQSLKTYVGAEMKPEVKDVFDRWFATREEIQKAREDAGLTPMQVPEGLSPEVTARLDSLESQAKAQAESALLKEQMKELTQKNDAFLKKERERLTKEATAQVQELPVYKGAAELGKATKKNPWEAAHLFLENRTNDKVTAKFEELAVVHGFASGEEMAKAMVAADTQGGIAAEVKARVDQGMQAHAPLMDTAAIRVEALKAIHSEKMTELLALERQALSGLIKNAEIRAEATKRNRVEAQVEARAAGEEAKAILSKKAVKQATNPGPYITAERNAALRAQKALAAKDFEAAAEAKRQQMLNHALAREALRNQDLAEKALNYLSKPLADLEKMPFGFVRQLEDLLQKVGLHEPKERDLETLSSIAESMRQKGEEDFAIANATGLIRDAQGQWVPESLKSFIDRVNDDYFGIQLPPSILSLPEGSYRDLKLQQFLELRDGVKTIAEAGKRFDRFLGAFDKADIKEAARAFALSVAENYGSPEATNLLPGSPHATKFQKWLDSILSLPAVFNREMDTILTVTDKLDGLKEGPAKEYIYRPMTEAEGRRRARTSKAMEAVDKLFEAQYTPQEIGKYKDTPITIEGRNFTKDQVLAMALNWGNAGNRDRLLRGFGWTEAQVEDAFKHLGKKDWDFAQSVWTYLHTYWPDIVALEMKMTGSEPKGVEPLGFTNAHGTYEGGYYPISYDFEKSSEAFKNAEQKTALYKQFGTASAQTEQGHTQARVDTLNRPLRLSLDVLTNHIEDVIHDLEFREPVVDLARFLKQKESRIALTNALGVRGYAALSDWLKNVASGPSEPLSFGEQAARWLRFRATFFYMGYRIASAPKIFLENLNNLSSELGVSTAARALKDYYTGESGTHEFVTGKSSFMKERGEHLDRDLGDISDRWQGKGAGNFQKFAFYTHAFLDQGASFPLWTWVYKQAIAGHGDETLAIHQADEAVKKTFMSGGLVDQAPVMQGSEKMKALTVAFGYQSMMWNRYSRQRFQIAQAWNQGDKAQAIAIAARAHLYTFLMPAAIMTATSALLHNSQSESDDGEKKMLAHLLEEGTPLKFIPVARDLAPYAIGKALGEKGRDLQITPLERAAQTLIDPAAAMFQATFGDKPLSDRFPEQVTNAVSLSLPFPKQLNDIVFNFIDWQRGQGDLTWKDFIQRRSRK